MSGSSVPNRYTEHPLALSVESIRRRLLTGVAIPQEIVNEALATTKKHLRAKRTQYFTHRGRVVEQREVEDHDTQLRAADQVYSIAGVYAREKDNRPAVPSFAMEVDAKTGVVRIIVGGSDANALAPIQEEQLGITSASDADIVVKEDAPSIPMSASYKQRGQTNIINAAVFRVLLDEEDKP